MKNLVQCYEHSSSYPVMACHHVKSGGMLHLYIVPSDDEWPLMSWCEDCEEARLEDKGWYDKADAMAKWSIICGRCFEVVVTSSKSLTEYPPEETPS